MADSENRSRHMILSGRVIGVGMRWRVETLAAHHGIGGWVRNRSDGTVEALFTATAAQETALIAALRASPQGRGIDRIALKDVRPRSFSAFRRLPTFQSRPKDAPAAGQIETSATPPAPVHVDEALRAVCQKAHDHLPAELHRHVDINTPLKNWRFGQFRSGAARLGLHLRHLGENAPPLLLVEDGSRRVGLDATRPSWLSPLSVDLSNDKGLTKTLLAAAGLPVARGTVVDTEDDGLAVFAGLGSAAAIKPVRGSDARGVSTAIASRAAFREAWACARAARADSPIIVEEFICGVDLRVLLAGHEIMAVYLRLHANIVGDGSRSVSELIAEKNALRRKLPGTSDAYLVPRGARARQVLNAQGMDLDSIPPRGHLVLLGDRPNYTDGADMVPITAHLHPEIGDICRAAVEVLGSTGWWGLDLLCEDFTQPPAAARTVICEANSRPVGGVFRHATHGTHVYFIEQALGRVARLAPTPSQSFRGPWFVHAPINPAAVPEAFRPLAAPAGTGCRLAFGEDRIAALNAQAALNATLGPALPCIVSNRKTARAGVAFAPLPETPTLSPAETKGPPAFLQAGFETISPAIARQLRTGRLVSLEANSSFARSLLRPRRRLALYECLSSMDVPHLPVQEISTEDLRDLLGADSPICGDLLIRIQKRPLRVLPLHDRPAVARVLEQLASAESSIYLAAAERYDLEAAVVGSLCVWVMRTSYGTASVRDIPPDLDALARDAVAAVPGLRAATVHFAQRASPPRPGLWTVASLTSGVVSSDFPSCREEIDGAMERLLLEKTFHASIPDAFTGWRPTFT